MLKQLQSGINNERVISLNYIKSGFEGKHFATDEGIKKGNFWL